MMIEELTDIYLECSIAQVQLETELAKLEAMCNQLRERRNKVSRKACTIWDALHELSPESERGQLQRELDNRVRAAVAPS